MNWLYYLAEANLYLGVFYLAYRLFLTKETYYQLTRAYLLFGCVVSFILPVLQIGALKPVETVVTTTVAYTLPEYVAPQAYIPRAAPVVEHHLTADDYLMYSYLAGAAIIFLMLMVKLFVLFKLIVNAKRVDEDKYKLVYLPQTNVAFSFFNYLFIGAEAQGANTIIRHELVHIRQRHSLDIVFLELLKVISWFNPFIYLLQNSLKTVHEYIADEQTAAYETDALTYSSFLVNNAYGAGGSSITHSFFNYNLLKKRIIMLNQKRSGNLARLKYLVVVPVCAGLLCASTLAFSKTYGWVDIDPAKALENSAVAHPATTPATNANVISKKKRVFPIPSFTGKGYEYLFHQVMKTVSYNPAEKDKGAFVVVGFDVANNGILSNIKIEKSGGREFDAKTLNAYKTFNMPVNDKPGHRRSLVIFYNGQPTSETDIYRGGDKYCISSWVVSDWEYIVKRTGRGFEYDEYSEYLDNKFNTRVVIYDANGKYVPVSLNKATADELALLKNKYGYTFPPLPKGPVKFPPPVVKLDEDPAGPVTPSGYKQGYESLTRYFTFTSVFMGGINFYQSSGFAKGPTIGDAVVVVGFNVGKDGKLSNPKLVKRSNSVMDDATISAFGSYTGIVTDKPGFHTYLVHISTHGHTEYEDALVCKKYGYDNHYTIAIAGNRSNNRAPDNAITTDGPHVDLQEFAKYLSQNVHYPAVDRQDTISGRVITIFAVNANGNLQYAKVVSTPSEAMGNEVIRVLKKWPRFSWFKPGVQYAVPVNFTLGYVDSSGPIVETKSRKYESAQIYNPNAVDIPGNPPGSLMLNEILLRGYIKNSQ